MVAWLLVMASLSAPAGSDAKTAVATPRASAAKKVVPAQKAAKSGAAATEAGAPVFAEVCCDDFEDETYYSSKEQIQQAWKETPGFGYEIKQADQGGRPICDMKGLFRQQEPWAEGSALRFSLFSWRCWRIYLWRGNSGVCIGQWLNWANGRHMAGYGISRTDTRPIPVDYALWAFDEGRCQQSSGGTILISYADGRICVTRGATLLFSLPMEGPPNEVYLDIDGRLRGARMEKISGLPSLPKPGAALRRVAKPAELDWTMAPVENIKFDKLPDGRVELSAAEKTGVGKAVAPLPSTGLCEYIFEVEGMSFGMGLLLLDKDGNEICRGAFMKEQGDSTRLQFGLLEPNNGTTDRWCSFDGEPVPFVSPGRQWVSILMGGNVMKMSISPDGVNWTQSMAGMSRVGKPPAQIGLYCVSHDRPRKITLRSVEMRRVEGLSALAPEALMARVAGEIQRIKEVKLSDGKTAAVKPVGEIDNFDVWRALVEASRPSDVAAGAWENACTLVLLAENPFGHVREPALFRLMDNVAKGTAALPVKAKALRDAARMLNTMEEGTANRLGDALANLAKALLRSEDPTPYTTFSRVFYGMPCSRYIWRRIAWEELFVTEATSLIGRYRWKELDMLVHAARLLEEPRRSNYALPKEESAFFDLVDWAAANVPASYARRGPGTRNVGGLWRCLLSSRQSKEGFNATAEFLGALQSGGYKDACQILVDTADPASLGLSADAGDPRRAASYAVFARTAMEQTPQMRAAMEKEFGAVGRLRLRSAVKAGDETALGSLAIQFAGTSVAAEAEQWLGDRAVSSGRFAAAVGHYKAAMQAASARQKLDLPARIRLAAAMSGRDVGEPVRGSVLLGDDRFAGDAFEKLVAEARQTHGGDSSSAEAERPAACPSPGKYTAQARGRIDGGDVVPSPGISSPESDWGARLTTAATTRQKVIFCNRAEAICFDALNRQTLWQQKLQADKGQQTWPGVPLRAAMASGRCFVRQLTKDGPALTCLNVADGKPQWTTGPDLIAASDPLISGDNLFVITLRPLAPRKLIAALTRLDPASGAILEQNELAEFLDVWQGMLPCQAAVADEKIVITGGGAAICCTQSGKVLWVRQQVWMAPRNEEQQDRPWWSQPHLPPLIVDGRVYAVQPGMWSAECFQLSDGRLLWQKTLPKIQCIVGAVDDRLIVRTCDELVAVDRASGKTAWRVAAAEPVEARWCGTPGGVVYVRWDTSDDANKPRKPVLVWLDAKTGKTTGEAALDVTAQVRPLFGPLFMAGDHFWALFALQQNPAHREIWQLTRQ